MQSETERKVERFKEQEGWRENENLIINVVIEIFNATVNF